MLAASPARLLASETGLVLMYNDLEPYLKSRNDQVSGFLADHVTKVAVAANIKPLWRNIPWEKQLAILQRNQPNVCAVALFKTPERESYSKFTDAIGTDEGFVLVSVNSNEAMKRHIYFKDVLNDKTLKPLLQINTVYSSYVNKLLAEKKLPRLPGSVTRMMRMLVNNPNSYIIVTPIMGEALIEQNGFSDILVAHDHYKDLKDVSPYFIACSLSTDDTLFDRFNSAIKHYGIAEPS